MCFSMRSLAISKYSSSNSKPMYCLLVFKHAIAVVLLPMKGSKTTLFSFVVCNFIILSNASIGFWVGWYWADFIPPATSFISVQTFVHRLYLIYYLVTR